MENKKNKGGKILKKVSIQSRKSPKQSPQYIKTLNRIKSSKMLPKNSPPKISILRYTYLHKPTKPTTNKEYYKNDTNLYFSNQISRINSYLSTPKQKPMQKFNTIKSHHNLFQHKIKSIYQSTSDQNISEEYIKIVYYFNHKKIGQKIFYSYQSVALIKSYLIQLLKKQPNIYNYYGMISIVPIPYNHGIYQLINGQQVTIATILNKKIIEIVLQPILINDILRYDHLMLKDFRIFKYLGCGGFSKVYLGYCKRDRKICVLKFIEKNKMERNKMLKILGNEKDILFSIDHQNLIKLFYAFETVNYLVFIIQYCQNGNLYSLLTQQKTIKQNIVKYICWQVIKGLQYLHENNILFRDLKLQNILFDSNGRIKINDFGLSKPSISEDDITYSYCGSPQYMAPEMLARCGHSFKVDYYALGVLVYQLLYGVSPFHAEKKNDIFQLILYSEPKFPKEPEVSKEGKDFIKGLLVKNPNYRIGSLKGIKQLKSHPWVRSMKEGDVMNLDIFNFKYKELWISVKQQKEIKEYFKVDYEEQNYIKQFLKESFVSKKIVEEMKKNIVVFEGSKNKNKSQKLVKLSHGKNKVKNGK